MFKGQIRSIGSIFLFVIVNSCYTNITTWSVLKPAEIILPASVQRISILPLPGVTENNHRLDSISTLSIGKKTDVRLIKMGYLDGMYDNLINCPRFQKVVMTDTACIHTKDYKSLKWTDLQWICMHDTTDALLILTKSVIYDKPETTWNTVDNTCYNVVGTMNHTQWALFTTDSMTAPISISLMDSFIIDDYLNTVKETENALYQVCFLSGQLSGTKICPSWKDVTRIVYTGPGATMHEAFRYLMNNQWTEAAEIWNKLSNEPNKSLASKAAYNMAVAWEHGDVPDQAILWINYADSLQHNNLTAFYMKILEEQLKNHELLDQQMKGAE